MVKSKYTFEDLNKRETLPLDANAYVEEYARKFQDPGLMAMLRLFRERKVTDGYIEPTGFGEAIRMNSSGSPEVIFSFQNGICKHFTPIVWIDGRNVAKPSVKIF